MTTEIAPATLKTLNGVTTAVAFKLDKATQGELDSLNHDASDLAGRIDEWRQDQDQLYLTAGGMLVDDALERKAELTSEHASLSDAYRELVWRQFALREKLLPFYQASAKAAAAESERVLEETLKDFATWGINENDVASANPEAARIQLRHRAMQEIQCLSASAEASRAKNAAEVFASRAGVAPTPNSCKIQWTPPAGTAAHVLRLLGT